MTVAPTLIDTIAALNNAVAIEPAQAKINTTQKYRKYAIYQIFAEDRKIPPVDVKFSMGKVTCKVNFSPNKKAVKMSPWGQAAASRNVVVDDIEAHFRLWNNQYPLNEVEAEMQGVALDALNAAGAARARGRSVADQNAAFAKVIMPYVDVQRLPVLEGTVEALDEALFNPPESSTDAESFQGLTNWIVKADTGVTEPGFVGQTVEFTGGATSTTIGGIDRSTVTKAKNFVGLHNGIGTQSFIEAVRHAKLEMGVAIPDVMRDISGIKDLSLFGLCGTAEYLRLMTAATADTSDLTAPASERVRIGAMGLPEVCGVPIIPTERMDTQTNTGGASGDPDEGILLINKPYWKFYAPKKFWMREMFFGANADRPYVITGQIDVVAALICENTRYGGAWVHKAR